MSADDRAHLLVAGQHQEGRRAAVGLHAGEVEAGLGLGQLARAVRAHRAAAVQVGIDQRRQRGRAFERRDRATAAARAGSRSRGGSRSRRPARRPRRSGRSRPSRRRCAALPAVAAEVRDAEAGLDRGSCRRRPAARRPRPSAPRAASLSLAPPPNAFCGLSPRSSQIDLGGRRLVLELRRDRSACRSPNGRRPARRRSCRRSARARGPARRACRRRCGPAPRARRSPAGRWRRRDWARTRCRRRRSPRRRCSGSGPLPFW